MRVTPQQFTRFWYKFLCQSLTSKLKCQNIWMTQKEHSREETGWDICSKSHLECMRHFNWPQVWIPRQETTRAVDTVGEIHARVKSYKYNNPVIYQHVQSNRLHTHLFIYPLPPPRRFMFSLSFVCLSVCLVTLLKKVQTDCDEILLRLWGGKKNKWLDFGSNLDHNSVLAEVCTHRMLGIW